MKRAKLAFGLLLAGVGAIGSAFTTRYTGAPASGWYSVDFQAIADDASVTYGQAHVATATFSANTIGNPPTSRCTSDASFTCAVFFTQNATTATAHITGDFN